MSRTQDSEQLSGAYRWEPEFDHETTFVDENWDYQPDDERLTDDDTQNTYTPPEREFDQDIRDGSLFKQEVQQDAEICSSCFLPNYDVIIPHSPRPSVDKGLVRYYIPIESTTHSENGAAPLCRGPPRACQCGRIGPARIRPLDKPHVAEFARNLSRTLTRKQRDRERRANEAEEFGARGKARKLRAEATRFEHDPLLLAFRALLLKSKHPMSDDSNLATALDDARFSTAYSWSDLLRVDGQQRRALPAPAGD
ncbi:hypothetical protein [Halococcus hamelinensis]|uniref:Uncharacterized protein n=1 Tax=Halococcus hamelinensis 100A6 TaxID=1132509 RepID=M0LYE0_9EURY|nr:hypothetical protein [Halococcus hamelinensis]EMA38456.1 hypothetical protein C447_09887 [Halococcus hamelinensis 100A6]